MLHLISHRCTLEPAGSYTVRWGQQGVQVPPLQLLTVFNAYVASCRNSQYISTTAHILLFHHSRAIRSHIMSTADSVPPPVLLSAAPTDHSHRTALPRHVRAACVSHVLHGMTRSQCSYRPAAASPKCTSSARQVAVVILMRGCVLRVCVLSCQRG